MKYIGDLGINKEDFDDEPDQLLEENEVKAIVDMHEVEWRFTDEFILNNNLEEIYSVGIENGKFKNKVLYAEIGDRIDSLIEHFDKFPDLQLIEYDIIFLDTIELFYKRGYNGDFKVDALYISVDSGYINLEMLIDHIKYTRLCFVAEEMPFTTIDADEVEICPYEGINKETVDYMKSILTEMSKVKLFQKVTKLNLINEELNGKLNTDIDALWEYINLLMTVTNLEELNLNKACIDSIKLIDNKKSRDIISLSINNNNFSSLKKVFKDFPNLQHLYCSDNQFDNYQRIENNNLKSLSISYTDRLKTSAIDYTNLISLSKLEIHGRNIKSIKLHDDIELTELNISNTSIGKNPLSYLPSKFIFDYTPLVNEDVFINTVMEANIEYSCLPRIVFDVEEDKGHKLPNYAFLKKKKVENAMYSDFTNDILKTLDYSDGLHSEYSTKIDTGSDENKHDKRYSWIIIDGRWGNGKSYYFKNFAVPLLEESEYEIITISSTSLLTSNVYMSIIEELGYKENVFDSIERIVHINIDGYKFFVKLYILFCLVLTTLFMWNVNSNGEQLTGFINYISVMVSVAIIPSMYFFTESLSKQNTIQKREQQSIDNYLTELNDTSKKVLVIDDIERCKVDVQMDIINSLAKLNENIHIILIADINELKNAISNNYSNETEYTSFISKYVDLNINFDTEGNDINRFDYFEQKFHISNENLKCKMKTIIELSECLEDTPLRELEQTIIQSINSYKPSNYIPHGWTYFYNCLTELVSQKMRIGEDIHQVFIFFHMYMMLYSKENSKLDIYNVYSVDELIVYANRRFWDEIDEDEIYDKSSLLKELYSEFLSGALNVQFKYIDEFIIKITDTPFELVLWEHVVKIYYPSVKPSVPTLLSPNRALIKKFIYEYEKEKVYRKS